MPQSIQSLAEIGDSAVRHMELTFRSLLAGHPDVAMNDAFLQLSTGEPHPFGNFTLISAPTNVEATLAAIDPFRTIYLPSAAILIGLPNADVDAVLQANGFVNHGTMPAMAVEIDQIAEVKLPEGYRFRRIGSEEGAAFTKAFAAGYELPDGVARVFSPERISCAADGPSKVSFYAATKDGEMAAVSAMFLGDGLAGIYCVATVPEHRQKGLGAYMTAQPLRMAKELGYRFGVLQASEPGYPVYKRLGFGDFGGVPLYVRIPE